MLQNQLGGVHSTSFFMGDSNISSPTWPIASFHTQMVMDYKPGEFPGYPYGLGNCLSRNLSVCQNQVMKHDQHLSVVDTTKDLPNIPASSVLKSRRWKFAHYFFTVQYDENLPLNVCSWHSWVLFCKNTDFMTAWSTTLNMVLSLIWRKSQRLVPWSCSFALDIRK